MWTTRDVVDSDKVDDKGWIEWGGWCGGGWRTTKVEAAAAAAAAAESQGHVSLEPHIPIFIYFTVMYL